METLLRTENLTKKFKNQVAIQNISMNVPENSVYGLLGPNGAGKSTTLKMIAGILKPTREVLFLINIRGKGVTYQTLVH